MKYIKCIAVFSAALLLGVSAFAQEDGNRDANGKIVRGPYETNSFGSNWFVSVGGGVDVVLDGIGGGSFNGGVTPTLDVNVGKWFTPSVGARFGYEGWAYKAAGTKAGNHLLHGDLLWNLSNAIGGYKQTRIYNIIPYAQAGVLASKTFGREFELGAGILNNFRITDHFAINLDLRGSMAKGEQFGCSGSAGLLSATVGLTYNIGNCTWKRVSSSDNSDALAAANDALAAAKAALAEEQANNEKLSDANSQLDSANKELQDELDKIKANPQVAEILNNSVIVYYAFGSSELTSTEEHRIAEFVQEHGADAQYNLVGSADLATGTREQNVTMCEYRVKAVTEILKGLGVSESNITAGEGVLAENLEKPEFGRSVTVTVK